MSIRCGHNWPACDDKAINNLVEDIISTIDKRADETLKEPDLSKRVYYTTTAILAALRIVEAHVQFQFTLIEMENLER